MIILISNTIYDYVKIPYQDNIKVGDIIVFKNHDKYTEHGKVIFVSSDLEYKKIKNIRDGIFLRFLNPHDIQVLELSENICKQYLSISKKMARKNNLSMRFVKVTMSLDQNKLFFLFSAEERVDFRDLVKQLSATIAKPVHMHQIGPRDHARIIGGIGICGKQQCCTTFLNHTELPSISLDMIRVQNLESRGPKKLSGNCGKLLCCLGYELQVYEELSKNMPQFGSEIKYKTDDGKFGNGFAKENDVLGQRVLICNTHGDYIWVMVENIKN